MARLCPPARIERQFLVYGPYKYGYASGREGDGFALAVASNKQDISVYAPPTINVEPLVAGCPEPTWAKRASASDAWRASISR